MAKKRSRKTTSTTPKKKTVQAKGSAPKKRTEREKSTIPESFGAPIGDFAAGDDIPVNFKPCVNGFNSKLGEELSAAPEGASFGLIKKGLAWNKKKLSVAFLGQESVPGLIEAIKRIATRWTENTSIEFVFQEAPNQASDIRVKFDESGTYWSLVGTTSSATSSSGASMNLGFDQQTFLNPKELERLILHEFGHALGLAHEHQNKALVFNENEAIAYFRSHGLGHLSDANIKRQFEKLGPEEIDERSTEFDVDSIMLYSFPESVATPTKYNYVLSTLDKETIRKLYPEEAKLIPARPGMEIEVKVSGSIVEPKKVAYYLFGKDEALFYFFAESAGDYELNVSSKADKNVIDPFQGVPLFLKDPKDPKKGRSIVEVGLLNNALLFGAEFEIFKEDSKERVAGESLPDSKFSVDLPENPTDLPATSKTVDIPGKGFYFIKARISSPKGDEPCRFVLSIRKKA
jgi:serralysin